MKHKQKTETKKKPTRCDPANVVVLPRALVASVPLVCRLSTTPGHSNKYLLQKFQNQNRLPKTIDTFSIRRK